MTVERTFLRRLISNTAVGFIGSVLQKALAFATTLVLARGLGDDGFGVYSYVVAYMFFFGFASDLGMERVLTREFARAPQRAGELIGSALLLKLALSTVAMVAAMAIAWLLGVPEAIRACIVPAAFGLPLSIVLIFQGYFQTRYELKYMFGATLPATLLFLVAAGAVVYFELPLPALFYASLAIGVMVLIGLLLIVRSQVRISLQPRWRQTLPILRDAWEVGLFVLLFMVAARIDQVMLFHMRGVSDVGLYTAGVRISEALVIIPDILMLTAFPLLVSTQHSAPEQFHQIYRLSFKYLTAVIVPVALLLTVLRREVIVTVFGHEYGDGANAFAILTWGMFFAYAGAVYLNLFIAQARQRLILWVSVIGALLNVVLNAVWIPRFGPAGAAMATVVANVASFSCWCAVAETRPYMVVCLREAWPSLLAAVAVGGALWLRPAEEMGTVAIVLLIYPAVLWALGGLTWGDVALVRRLFAYEPGSSA